MFKITLSNSAGPLDVRTVETTEEIRAAILDIAAGINDYYPGDTITVSEAD